MNVYESLRWSSQTDVKTIWTLNVKWQINLNQFETTDEINLITEEHISNNLSPKLILCSPSIYKVILDFQLLSKNEICVFFW